MTTPRLSPRLTDELGQPIWLRPFDSSSRSNVWLAEIGSAPVVVKEVVGSAEMFDREVTGLRLAGRVDPPVTPRLLGADEQVLVLEYLEAGLAPADWLIGYATALATLHSATSAADSTALPRWSPPGSRDVDAFLALARSFDVTVTAVVESEMDDLLNRLVPREFALLHGDPCPDNAVHTAAGTRFFDLERVSLGDGATELAYPRVGFPTCLRFQLPDKEMLAAAEDAYRAVRPAGDVLDACVGWLIRGDALVWQAKRGSVDHLARVRRQDWQWGPATARQRLVHRLGVAAEHDRMIAFRRLATELREKLVSAWATTTGTSSSAEPTGSP